MSKAGKIIIIVFVIIVVIGAGFYLYSQKRASEKMIAGLERVIQSAEVQMNTLSPTVKKFDKQKEQYEKVRQSVKDRLGADQLKAIEAPLCDTWSSIVKVSGFAVESCKKDKNNWTRLIAKGPKEGKSKLYENLEAAYKPVNVRACLFEEKDDQVKLTFVIRDKLEMAENQLDESLPFYFNKEFKLDDIAIKFNGDKMNELKAKFEQLNKQLEEAREKTIESKRLRLKTTLLLGAIRQYSDPTKKQFNLAKREKRPEQMPGLATE